MLDSQYKMNLIKIGLKIAYYRKLQGMTQEELAEACDLSAGYISQLEGLNCFFSRFSTLILTKYVLNTKVRRKNSPHFFPFWLRLNDAAQQKQY